MKPYNETKILRVNPEWLVENLHAIIGAYKDNPTFKEISHHQKEHMIKMIMEMIFEAEKEMINQFLNDL